MQKPLIVAATHNRSLSKLLNFECRRKFIEHVLWLLTPDTLLLMEGAYDAQYYQKEHPKYSIMRYDAETRLALRLIHSPTIGWRDGRYATGGSDADFMKLINYAKHFILPRITLATTPPKTMEELRVLFVNGALRYSMSESDDEGIRAHITHQLEWNDQFDKPMIAGARGWVEKGRPVIMVCGALHALTIHRSTGWPITFLLDTPERVRDLYTILIFKVLYPEKVLGKTPDIADSFAPAS